MSELPTDGTIYRLPPLQRYSIFLVTLGVIAFLWILMLFTVSSSSSKPETVAFLYKLMGGISLICLVVGILANLTTIGTKLVLNPQGIFIYRSGSCLYSPWKNIVAVEQEVMGAFSLDVLRLDQKADESISLEQGIETQTAVLTKAPLLKTTEQMLPILRGLVLILNVLTVFSGRGSLHLPGSYRGINPWSIPVGMFGKAWQEGDLYSEVQRYAPQVFKPSRLALS
jgi:hypothetical protein